MAGKTDTATLDAPNCLIRSVTSAFAAEPTLEAVTFNKSKNTISVATLGRTDETKLAEQISSTIQQAQSVESYRHCRLLEGEDDCATCDAALTPAELRAITIKHDGDATTIARVT